MDALSKPVINGAENSLDNSLEEFLYMDPDTGMIVCMIADGDGFRPATAAQEMESLPLHWFNDSPAPTSTPVPSVQAANAYWANEQASEQFSLDAFVQNFEHAFLAPSAG